MQHFLHHTIKQKIIIHVSYRHVFNAPVRISECRKWLALDKHELIAFNEAIKELEEENLITVKNDLLCVKGSDTIIDQQANKDRLSESLMAKGEKSLLLLARLPFIRYIGVSGSVAANNPIGYKSGKFQGFVDLDLFVICRANCLWLLFLIERVIKNLRGFYKGHHFYCFNYATDESFLEVYNKNFYTATEINNLKTIYDDGTFGAFKAQNQWSERFYKANDSEGIKPGKSTSILWTLLLAPINWLCFIIFCLGRALWRFEFSPLLEIFGGFNPVHKCNLKRISNANGGYQEAIKQKFSKMYKTHFPAYFSEDIIEVLFPHRYTFHYNTSANVDNKEHKELFTKYKLETNAENFI